MCKNNTKKRTHTKSKITTFTVKQDIIKVK